MIVPDPSAVVHVDLRDGSVPEHFFLCDIHYPAVSPWECCVRAFLRRAIEALNEAAGLELLAAIEQDPEAFPQKEMAERPAQSLQVSSDVFRDLVCIEEHIHGITPLSRKHSRLAAGTRIDVSYSKNGVCRRSRFAAPTIDLL